MSLTSIISHHSSKGHRYYVMFWSIQWQSQGTPNYLHHFPLQTVSGNTFFSLLVVLGYLFFICLFLLGEGGSFLLDSTCYFQINYFIKPASMISQKSDWVVLSKNLFLTMFSFWFSYLFPYLLTEGPFLLLLGN